MISYTCKSNSAWYGLCRAQPCCLLTSISSRNTFITILSWSNLGGSNRFSAVVYGEMCVGDSHFLELDVQSDSLEGNYMLHAQRPAIVLFLPLRALAGLLPLHLAAEDGVQSPTKIDGILLRTRRGCHTKNSPSAAPFLEPGSPGRLQTAAEEGISMHNGNLG